MFFWEVLGVTGLDDGERRRTFPVALHLRQPLVLEGRGSNIGEVVVTGRSSRAVGA
jgi:hypothetical protein